MWLVCGPLAEFSSGRCRRYRDQARAQRAADRLNSVAPGHVALAGRGNRYGWSRADSGSDLM